MDLGQRGVALLEAGHSEVELPHGHCVELAPVISLHGGGGGTHYVETQRDGGRTII